VTANRTVSPFALRASTSSCWPGCRPRARPRIVNSSDPSRPSDWRDCPSANVTGSTPIPTRLERWMRSNDSAITAETPRRFGPFAAQSRDEPDPYSLPVSTISGTPSAR
jgi:hypothetical protein